MKSSILINYLIVKTKKFSIFIIIIISSLLQKLLIGNLKVLTNDQIVKDIIMIDSHTISSGFPKNRTMSTFLKN